MAYETSTKRTNTSTQNAQSRYVQGGDTDKYPNRVGWWERRLIPQRDSDIVIFVNPNEVGRPDMIAYRVYQNPKLAWLVLQYNSIVDINTEIVDGARLRLPDVRRVTLEIMTKTAGGVKVK